ncbi:MULTISPECIES: hypothetical protein [Rhodococcus]|uniref:hypothetical protein n=1 Tax=Rhodococcus TaxID=1827 RepID=UPI0013C8A177|nr:MULTISPECIES: hypothetical protein [Rhodococcus]KAF0963123.1 hypothetical protein MLGJGCBP_03747 [Rhodococcus sp. T7]UOT08336.1 hypothetical protein MPY17_39190 [Rhodococcus opacus]
MSCRTNYTGPGQGTRLDILDDIHTIKAGAEHTDGAYEVFEVEAPHTSSPVPLLCAPWMKTVYLLDGGLTVRVAGKSYEPGASITIPAGVPNTWAVTTSSARILAFTHGARAGRFFADVVRCVPTDRPPDEVAPLMFQVAQRHSVRFEGGRTSGGGKPEGPPSWPGAPRCTRQSPPGYRWRGAAEFHFGRCPRRLDASPPTACSPRSRGPRRPHPPPRTGRNHRDRADQCRGDPPKKG